MAGPYRFALAHPDDDPALRTLLRTNAVPGQMTLSYEREPNYFLGCSVTGAWCQTLVARHQESGQIAALATRSARPLYVNGAPEEVGYLGGLRVDRQHRGRWIVPLGFRYFAHLHRADREADREAGRGPTGYLTTIIEGNRQAQGVLVEKARGPLPAYRAIGRLQTLALVVRRPRRVPTGPWELRSADGIDPADLVAFLRRQGARRQFFPVWSEEDFGHPRTRGLDLQRCAVALRGGRIAGVLALWDQSAYKQTVVRAYRSDLRRLKPLYGLAARLLGARPLPALGEALDAPFAALLCIADDDFALFTCLLTWVYNRATESGAAFLALGLTDRDPLLPAARRWLHIAYTSTIYTVTWAEDEGWHQQLDGRPLHLELATL